MDQKIAFTEGTAITNEDFNLAAKTPADGGAVKVAFSVNDTSPADAEAYNPETEKAKSPVKSLWDDVWTLPDVVIDESSELVSKPGNVWLLLAAGGASAIMHNTDADDEVAEHFEESGNLNEEVDRVTDFLGGPGFHFAAAGLWYLTSADAGDTENKDKAWTMIEALSTTGAITLGLKAIRNNDTPNGKPWAWPSGHTSSSFTVASVLDEFYGPEVGIPAYIGAGFVGYRMMDSGDHWASDVLFGGILGYLVGHQVAGKHKSPKIGDFEVVPMTTLDTGEPVMGFGAYKSF